MVIPTIRPKGNSSLDSGLIEGLLNVDLAGLSSSSADNSKIPPSLAGIANLQGMGVGSDDSGGKPTPEMMKM